MIDPAALTALITGAFTVLVLVVRHWLSRSDMRLQASEARLDAYDAFIADVIAWGFDCEQHIILQKPPPPPERPRSLVQFFSMRLGGRPGVPGAPTPAPLIDD